MIRYYYFSFFYKMSYNGLHIAVRAGFSAENSERATKLKFINKFQTEALFPPDGNMFVVCCILFIKIVIFPFVIHKSLNFSLILRFHRNNFPLAQVYPKHYTQKKKDLNSKVVLYFLHKDNRFHHN